MMKSFCFLFTLFFSITAYSDAYKFHLKGSYKTDSSQKTPVDYTLSWNESKGKITGTYGDNYFIDNAEVSGSKSDIGRNFTVELPGDKKGVRSITLLTSDVGPDRTGESIPVSVVTRDRKGNPLTTVSSKPAFTVTSVIAQRQEEDNCEKGFGSLAGFCGVYAGMITEDQDKRNKCNLLYVDAVRLELNIDSSLILHLGATGNMIEEPVHRIGRLPVDPETNSIDVMSRSCRPLPGVNARGDSCKQLNLRGEFSVRGTNRHFRGTYTIKEEGTNNECTYNLSMDMQDLD